MEVKVTQYGPLSINYSTGIVTIRYRMTHDLFNKVKHLLNNRTVELVTPNYITFLAIEKIDIIDKVKNISINYRKCQNSGKSLQQ